MRELVTVLMSVHNEPDDFLNVSVKSICEQTYPNIEFLIIDDASDERTYKHLCELEKTYSIIKVIRNESNLGLTSSLNKGISLAKGEYIARMDADDFSCPTRLQKQVEYMESHSDIDILGTGVVSFGASVKFMSPINGASYKSVQSDLFFMSSLCHPSVIIRTSFLKKTGLMYDVRVKKGQDYDLWERASIFGRLEVLPDVLLYYRCHRNQITSMNRDDQNRTSDMIMRRRLNRIGIIPTEKDMQCHMALAGKINEVSISEIKAWVNKLVSMSADYDFIDTKMLEKKLNQRYVFIKLKRHIMPTIDELKMAFSVVLSRLSLILKLMIYKNKIKSELCAKA